jgi:hypothetical protein
MRRTSPLKLRAAILAAGIAVLTGVPSGLTTVHAQSAREILQTAMERYEQRMEGIENYTVIQSMGGMESTAFFQRVETEGDHPVYRQKTSLDISQAGSQESTNPFLQEGGGEMATGVADPSALFGQIAPRATLQETEEVAGHDAWVISIDDLSGIDFGASMGSGAPGAGPEGSFQPTSLKLWIDRDRYVTLRTAMTGTMEMQGQSTEITFDARMDDYREVEGMLHPFHTEVSIDGMAGALTSEQQAQLSEAQKQLQEQLENMPEAQRAMVEKMMKDRMPDMEAMAGSGAMTFTMDVKEVRVNEGAPEAMAGQARALQEMTRQAREPNQEEAEAPTGIPPTELTPGYMEGEWCTKGLEPTIYRFYGDGSYHMAFAEQLRVDTSARARSYEYFLQGFEDSTITEKTEDGFTVMWRGEREIRWLRDCKGGR